MTAGTELLNQQPPTLPIVAGVAITQDSMGRVSLNALHKASGLGVEKTPSKWTRTKQAKELIDEAEAQKPDLSSEVISIQNGGCSAGIYADQLLAISYAGWLSPKFQLQVNQAFIESRTASRAPAIPQNLPAALRLAAELAEQNQHLLDDQKALNRLSDAKGDISITNAAKDLQVQRKALLEWLRTNRWIYRSGSNLPWCAYQNQIDRGFLKHRVMSVSVGKSSERIVQQVMVTPKGLTKLARTLTGNAGGKELSTCQG
jgi:phage antirepressor YoqD-like protein